MAVAPRIPSKYCVSECLNVALPLGHLEQQDWAELTKAGRAEAWVHDSDVLGVYMNGMNVTGPQKSHKAASRSLRALQFTFPRATFRSRVVPPSLPDTGL